MRIQETNQIVKEAKLAWSEPPPGATGNRRSDARFQAVRSFFRRPSVRVGAGVLGQVLIGSVVLWLRNREHRQRQPVAGAFFRRARARFS